MTFLNPFVLFGLFAAGIPLLLHLLNRRKLSTVEFSSLLFIKELQKTRTVRRIRLRQWILLALRTLLIAAIVLAFSRPAFRGSAAGFGAGKAQTAITILLDDSPSMAAHGDKGTSFSRAKEAAAKILTLAGGDDRIRLVPLSALRDPNPFAPVQTRSDAGSALARMEVSPFRTPFPRALKAAGGMLSGTSEANREIYLVTDNQASQWISEQDDSSRFDDARSRVFVVAVPISELENAGVTRIDVTSRIIAAGRPAGIRATLTRSVSSAPRTASVGVYLEGARVAQRLVELPAGGIATADFEVTPKTSGITHGAVRLDDDALEADNTRPFVLDVPDHVNVLLVGPSLAESRFPSMALSLAGDSTASRLFAVQRVAEQQLASVDFGRFDAIVLCGPTLASAVEGARAANFVRTGGALMAFPGPGVDLNVWNRNLLARLDIPAAAADSTRPAGAADISSPAAGFLSVSKADLDHPVFAGVFDHPRAARQGEIPFTSPRVTRAARLSVGRGGMRLMDLTDGRPMLAEYAAGAGRVFLFAVDAGMAWSDFPLQPMYAPLLHRSLLYLTARPQELSAYRVGVPLTFSLHQNELGASGSRFAVRAPSGLEQSVIARLQSATGLVEIRSEPSREAGLYDLVRHGPDGLRAGDPVVRAAAVAIDPGESDLRTATSEQTRAAWGRMGLDDSRARVIEAGDALVPAVLEARVGVELWKYFIFFALLFAIAEMVVGRVARGESGGESQP